MLQQCVSAAYVFFLPPCPKDPAVLKILQRSNLLSPYKFARERGNRALVIVL